VTTTEITPSWLVWLIWTLLRCRGGAD
jgi:hypothetical protein